VKYGLANTDLLFKHKLEVAESNSQNINVHLLDKIMVNVNDYKGLLKVLDIVIAY